MTRRPPRRIAAPRRGRMVPPLPRRALTVTILAVGALSVVVWFAQPRGSVPGSPPRHLVSALLDSVAVVPERVHVPGYERDCSGSSACVFGPAWSDNTGAAGAGNGCSTRLDVLSRDLIDAAAATSEGIPGGSEGCEVDTGVLVDPYTGRIVDAGATGTRGIHVDHVYPLAAAWDLGAWEWSREKRASFANDTDRNLLAVTGTVNTRKSDATPAGWMPPDVARHCFYAARYLTAAVAYGLPITAADHDALADAVRRCPTGGRPQ